MKTSFTLGYSPYDSPNDGVKPFDLIFDHAKDLSKHQVSEVDAIVLWGGTDIHPDFYNRSVHQRNHCPQAPSQRDWFEWELMREAAAQQKPIIGVCRGAQFICAFAGGILVQDVDGHGNGYHPIVTHEGEVIQATSSHHQMMYPWAVEHKMLAWSSKTLGSFYHGLTDIERKEHILEPEVVYFPSINAIAAQPHPEWMASDCAFVTWLNQQIIDHLTF